MEKSYWVFDEATRVMIPSVFTYKNTPSPQRSIPTSTLLEENNLVEEKHGLSLLQHMQVIVAEV